MATEHDQYQMTNHDAQEQEIAEQINHEEKESQQQSGTTATHTHHHHHHHHRHHIDSSERFKNRTLMTAKRRKLIEKYLFRFTCLVALIVVLTCLYVYLFNPQ